MGWRGLVDVFRQLGGAHQKPSWSRAVAIALWLDNGRAMETSLGDGGHAAMVRGWAGGLLGMRTRRRRMPRCVAWVRDRSAFAPGYAHRAVALGRGSQNSGQSSPFSLHVLVTSSSRPGLSHVPLLPFGTQPSGMAPRRGPLHWSCLHHDACNGTTWGLGTLNVHRSRRLG